MSDQGTRDRLEMVGRRDPGTELWSDRLPVCRRKLSFHPSLLVILCQPPTSLVTTKSDHLSSSLSPIVDVVIQKFYYI